MEEARTVVIKVKYGDVLRRFSTRISDYDLGVDMNGLKEKIYSLFKLPRNSALMLTYTDEDSDEVMLVDDDDLRDIRRQELDPLRITVKLSAEKNVGKCDSSGSSAPLRSPPLVQKTHRSSETALESLGETLVKLSTNLASKLLTSTPNVTELIHYFSEVCSLYLAYICVSEPRMQTPTHNFVMKGSETSKADVAKSTVLSNVGSEEFIKQNESLENLELLATVIDHAAKLRDSQTIKAGRPVSDSLQSSGPTPKSRVVPSMAGKKEKLEHISERCLKDKSSLRSSHCPSATNKDKMSDVSSNVPVENAISPGPELDLVNPSSKKNASASPLHPACGAVTLSANSILNDGLSKSCHQDYYCDVCEAYPIFGHRFRSKERRVMICASSVFPEREKIATTFE